MKNNQKIPPQNKSSKSKQEAILNISEKKEHSDLKSLLNRRRNRSVPRFGGSSN